MNCLHNKIFFPYFCGTNASITDGQIDARSLPLLNHNRLAAIAAGSDNINVGAELSSIIDAAYGVLYSAVLQVINIQRLTASPAIPTLYPIATANQIPIAVPVGTCGIAIKPRTTREIQGIRRLKITDLYLWSSNAVSNFPITVTADGVSQVIVTDIVIGKNKIGTLWLCKDFKATYDTNVLQPYATNSNCPNCPNSSIPCAVQYSINNGNEGTGKGINMFGFAANVTCACDFNGAVCALIDSGAIDGGIKAAIALEVLRRTVEGLSITQYTTLDVTQAGQIKGYYDIEFDKMKQYLAANLRNTLSNSGDNYCITCNNTGVSIMRNFF